MPFDSLNTNRSGAAENSLGRLNFVALTGLDTSERQDRLATILARIDEENLEVVRVAFADTHGIVRMRPIEARLFSQAARNGVPFTTALFAMDSANNIFQNVFARDGGFGRDTMGGAGDMLAIPDLTTFRVLPWAHKCAWVMSDLYLSSGERCPFDPRLIMQTACERLAQRGLSYIGGVEIECHILKVSDPRNDLDDCTQPPTPPAVEALRHGYQYMSENVLDELEPVITRIRHALIGAGLPLRTVEAEWGPAQIEISLDPIENMTAADAVIILRTTVKQVCRRMGLLASFMTKPALPNVFSSGWHLHQSLFHSANGKNAFAEAGALLSSTGLALRGWAARTCTCKRGVFKSDNQWLQAAERERLGTEARGVVARQQGCDVSAGRRHGRSGNPYRKSVRRTGGQSVSLHGLANHRWPGRHGK